MRQVHVKSNLADLISEYQQYQDATVDDDLEEFDGYEGEELLEEEM
mgnify:CR=1 FL=1